MKHILNVIKDAFDPRDHVVAPNASTAPVVISYRSQVPYIKDQQTLGSCTAHAGTEHFERAVRVMKSDVPLVYPRSSIRLSPLFQYVNERLFEGTFKQDNGADSRTIFKVFSTIGCCLESSDVYDVTKLLQTPTAPQLREALNFKFQAYHRILDVDTAKTVLQSNYTFTLGVPLFKQFESDQAAADGLIAMPKGSSIGGHEIHVVGCDDSKQVLGEVGAFEVQNSWSDQWGDHGYAWIPYAYLNKLNGQWDAWMGHFGKPWRS